MDIAALKEDAAVAWWWPEGRQVVSPSRIKDWEASGLATGMFQPLYPATAILSLIERVEALEEALRAAREVVKVAEALTSSRGDDDWIWGVLAKIDAAIETPANPIEEVVGHEPARQD